MACSAAGVNAQPLPRFRRFCALACLCLLVASCSAIRTLYNQAEHVVAWRLDDYFDLTEAQRADFHARFRQFHAWHRHTQLAAYVAAIATAEQRLAQGPSPRDAEWLRAEARSQARNAIAHAHEDIAAFLASLSDRQVARARQRFERDNQKYAKEHGVGAAPEEQRRLRAKHDIEEIEHWTGSLSREQKARIAALSAQLPLDAELHQRDRIRRQQEFLGLLQQRQDGARFAARLRDWMLNWDETRPADIAAALERQEQARARMLIEVYALLEPAQRRKIAERLHWYADAMRDLSVG
jgi:hypothetical protein